MINLNIPGARFPDPSAVQNAEGIVAYGGDLSPERLQDAYSLGIFPWYNPGEQILWWSPDPRFVLFPGELKVSKSMRKILRDGVFKFTKDKCFEEVMRRCAETRADSSGTWISEDFIAGYTALHRLGVAHSFEAWQEDALVGGFYGVAAGRAFCGESMFSSVSNASKAVFIDFISSQRDFELIDCQIYSAHLESLGARAVSRASFLEILKNGGNVST